MGITQESFMDAACLPVARSVHRRGGKKNKKKKDLIAFFTVCLKWKQLNEVRQLASLKVATVPNCDRSQICS